MKSTRKSPNFGSARFTLDATDVVAATEAGLLRAELALEKVDPSCSTFGLAYDRQGNIGIDVFDTQKAIQARCKAFGIQCGFQLFVRHSNVKANNSGNAKYGCKILNGQQFFDSTTQREVIECLFYINVYSKDGQWKITEANFCHNHAKNIGSSRYPCVEGSIPRPQRAKRNTTQDMKAIVLMVQHNMLPAHAGSVSTLKNKTISTFLQTNGIMISASAVSRVKQAVDDKLHGDRLESYQKLESYFTLMCEKNPGSLWRLDKEDDGVTFKRACFILNVGIYAARMCKRLFGFDGAHLKGEMHQQGVFLVATTKDYNNHIVPIALALVPVEDYKNWCWFLELVREAFGDMDTFTVLSDRQKGLLSAVDFVFPSADHRFCLRHIMDNISKARVSLTALERGLICSMARSDCENDFKLFRAELNKTNASAVEYLSKIDEKRWIKYRFQEEFKLPTYGEITSNLSEQANNWMGSDMRSSKPLNAYHLFFLKLSEMLSERRQEAAGWIEKGSEHSLVLLLAAQLRDLSQASKICSFTPCMEGCYNVRHLGPPPPGGYVHPWRLVNLPDHECTCGGWRDEEFPCVHAVCAAAADGLQLEAMYDRHQLSIAYFRDTYSKPFKPWLIDISLAQDSSLRLPVVIAPPQELGERGLKPGPKPKHKRKRAVGGS